LLSVYLVFQLHLLFASAATMFMVNKDYHKVMQTSLQLLQSL